MGDTLAFRSDEGRGYRRNASGSWKQATIRRSPNEETQILLIEYIDKKELNITHYCHYGRKSLTYKYCIMASSGISVNELIIAFC